MNLYNSIIFIIVSVIYSSYPAVSQDEDYDEFGGKTLTIQKITPKDISLFRELEEKNLVPYQDIEAPNPKTKLELEQLGDKYFSKCEHAREMATVIYDWTTANFFRVKLFTNFLYTGSKGNHVDISSIIDLIWHSGWGRYNPQNKAFMGSLMLEPTFCEEDLRENLSPSIVKKLTEYTIAQSHILNTAISLLPRLTAQHPQYSEVLYRGAGQLGFSYYCAHFYEFPGNERSDETLKIPLRYGLDNFLREGHLITTKAPWSFTREPDLGTYAQGIIIVVTLSKKADAWRCGYVTPFSDNANKDEYLFSSGSQFLIKKNYWETTKRGETLFVHLEQLEEQETKHLLEGLRLKIQALSTEDEASFRNSTIRELVVKINSMDASLLETSFGFTK